MHAYKAIILDCGGVIFNYSFDKVFDHWAMVSKRNLGEIKSKFEFDVIYRKFEKGEVDASVFRTHVLNKIGLRISADEFDEGWNSIYLDLVPGIKQLLQELKKNYRLVALTNTNEIHAKKWKAMYAPLLNYFEKVFSSHEIHTRKPEREAYNTVLNYLRLNPDETIFLDDNTEHIKVALKMNITSIHVTSFRQMVEDLKKIGVEVRLF